MIPPYLSLPPTDRLLSPRTGWTRAHWEALTDHLLDSVVPYASPGFAQYRLPGRASWSGRALDGLEGFARTFLAAAFRIAGARGQVHPALIERYATGLANGTDPASGEAWPELTDCSQQMVEAASIAVGLHESRPWLWDRLPSEVRERVVAWLSGFLGKRTWDNNWMLFQTVSEEFVKSVGGPYAQDEIDRGLDRIEEWYVGDGWYTDGGTRNFDYYGGWALHLYPLLWTRMSGDADRAKLYGARLTEFLTTYQHFFGADGAPIHQGRSLCYRFASLAPVWLGALVEATPLAPGQTRKLASSVARHFAERGVPDRRGLLSLGWYDTFLPTTQAYSGPASPYWASKGLLGLLLPPEHPVWTAREQMLPIDEHDVTVAIPATGLLLHGTRHDGIVRLVNHGSDHGAPPDDPHYAKLAYSTRTAPEAAEHAWTRNVDNHLALVSPDGLPSARGAIHPLTCEGRTASSYTATPDGTRITTTSVVRGPWEVRIHEIATPQPLTPTPDPADLTPRPLLQPTTRTRATTTTTTTLTQPPTGTLHLTTPSPPQAGAPSQPHATPRPATEPATHSATPQLDSTTRLDTEPATPRTDPPTCPTCPTKEPATPRTGSTAGSTTEPSAPQPAETTEPGSAQTTRHAATPTSSREGPSTAAHTPGPGDAESPPPLARSPHTDERSPIATQTSDRPAGPAVREGGYAVSDTSPPDIATGPGWALARRTDGLTSAIIGLYGWQQADVSRDVESNAFGPHSAVPCLHADTPGLHVSLVVLSGDTVHPSALREAITVDVSPHAVTVAFPDGDRQTHPLTTPPTHLAHSPHAELPAMPS
ncbi:DUF2264 domain-containing protein [Nonomuraea sp. NPDC003804]|uniref:DUF2264 domain-containing protein n=1 Tax=Nonomuraea sp. NPDC003804 TaxID=3154547 RepID=UPI0033A553D6